MKTLQLAKKAQSECKKSRDLETKFVKEMEKCDSIKDQIKALEKKLSNQEMKTAETNEKRSEQDSKTNSAIYQAQREFDLYEYNLQLKGSSEHLVDGWETFKAENKINLEY